MYSIYVSVLQMDIVLSVAIIRKGNIILLKKNSLQRCKVIILFLHI